MSVREKRGFEKYRTPPLFFGTGSIPTHFDVAASVPSGRQWMRRGEVPGNAASTQPKAPLVRTEMARRCLAGILVLGAALPAADQQANGRKAAPNAAPAPSQSNDLIWPLPSGSAPGSLAGGIFRHGQGEEAGRAEIELDRQGYRHQNSRGETGTAQAVRRGNGPAGPHLHCRHGTESGVRDRRRCTRGGTPGRQQPRSVGDAGRRRAGCRRSPLCLGRRPSLDSLLQRGWPAHCAFRHRGTGTARWNRDRSLPQPALCRRCQGRPHRGIRYPFAGIRGLFRQPEQDRQARQWHVLRPLQCGPWTAKA